MDLSFSNCPKNKNLTIKKFKFLENIPIRITSITLSKDPNRNKS